MPLQTHDVGELLKNKLESLIGGRYRWYFPNFLLHVVFGFMVDELEGF
jgi:hypothetical protein